MHEPDVNKALQEAVHAIYVNDTYDFRRALWQVVRQLAGEEAVTLLLENPREAYEKYANEQKNQ